MPLLALPATDQRIDGSVRVDPVDLVVLHVDQGQHFSEAVDAEGQETIRGLDVGLGEFQLAVQVGRSA